MAGKIKAPRVPTKVSRAASTLTRDKSTHAQKSKTGTTHINEQETETITHKDEQMPAKALFEYRTLNDSSEEFQKLLNMLNVKYPF